MIGQQLGHWIIEAELGRGAMGHVYRARAAGPAAAPVAAVKLLTAERADDPTFRNRFQREIDILRELDHPNIVRFYESGVQEGVAYYAMEYVEGPDAEAVVRTRGRLPWPEVLDLAAQVVSALKHAHDRGIIHRDLKPANILMQMGNGNGEMGAENRTLSPVPTSSFAHVKLTDFGVARVFTRPSLTGVGHFIGTAAYLSPEQAAGKTATKRSDFYSLGGVLYHLLSGRPPFASENVVELMHKHCFALPERLGRLVDDLPPNVEALIEQMLAKDPTQRPADGGELLRQIDRLRGQSSRPVPLNWKPPSDSDVPSFFRQPAVGIAALAGDAPSAPVGGSVLGRLFNRASVLLTLLALSVGVIVWAFSRPRPSAAELYARAEPLMQSDRPADWERAWTDYLAPLEDRYPGSPFAADIAAFRQRLDDQAALRRALERQKTGRGRSDAQRAYEYGLQRCQAGDGRAAEQVWRSVTVAFQAVPSEERWVRLAGQGLAALKAGGSPDTLRGEAIRAARDHARQLRAEGHTAEAEAIERALNELPAAVASE